MERVFNFAPGPAMLPQQALETAAAEMLSYQGTGMSVMEMSHRSKGYQAIFDEAISLLRDLMHIPENYTVLLLQGGATGQFAAVPLNLLKTTADYADTGNFAADLHREFIILPFGQFPCNRQLLVQKPHLPDLNRIRSIVGFLLQRRAGCVHQFGVGLLRAVFII